MPKNKSHSHSEEHRRYQRHLVYWPAAIYATRSSDNSPLLNGETCEVSMGGVSILSEQSFALKRLVIVRLTVPPQKPAAVDTLIDLQCRMVYSYLDARHNRFRLGFGFDSLSDESKVLLYDVLATRFPAPY